MTATTASVAEAARGASSGAGSPGDRPPGEPRLVGYLYLLPAFAVFLCFVLIPLIHAGWISLWHWDGLTPATWAGVSNYTEVFTDPELRSAFAHALILLIFYAVLPLFIGLLLAGVMARARVRGLAFFRTILFLPQVIAMVVVAVMWKMIYDPENGAANRILGWFGIEAQGWLGDFNLALPAIGLIGTWVYFGLAMVLLTAGVQKIPSSLYDAARCDGAGPFREFLAVTLPGLRGEIAVTLTLTTVFALRNFDLVYITTHGGPGSATTVPAFQVFSRAFESGQVGSAAAVGLTLTAIIFLISLGINWVAERGVDHVTSRNEQTLGYVILGVFGLIALLPIAGIVFTALQDPNGGAAFGAFDGFHFGNFKDAWNQGRFGTYLKSSVIVAVVVVFFAGLFSIFAGYAFGLMRFRGSTVLFYIFLLGLMVPLEAIIVPLYYEMRDTWHLYNTYFSIILPQIATSVAFGTFWMRAFFRSVPRSLVEAARIDGASSWFTLWRVLLPLARPAVLTMTVLLFMWTWNEFLLVLVMVSDEDLRTAPLGLSFFQGRNTSDLTLLAAGSVLVALPVVLVYVFLQRHFIRGMLAGAVKG